jgi:hypothetical protein
VTAAGTDGRITGFCDHNSTPSFGEANAIPERTSAVVITRFLSPNIFKP